MTCRRVWEVEAIEDGRLDAPSMASFERHSEACADCTRAFAALRALREMGRRIEPRRLSPFEHRRKRGELLRRANTEALLPPQRRNLSLLFAFALAALLVVVGYRHESRPGVAAPKAERHEGRAPAFELRPIGPAIWHDVSSGPSARIVFSSGTLAVHVEHLGAGQRFVVALPDGEVEVRGTRFIVEARDGRTERVLVTEGVVALRLAGVPARSLAAGESYVRGNTDAKSEPSSAQPTESAPSEGAPAAPTTSRVAGSVPTSPPHASKTRPAGTVAAEATTAVSDPVTTHSEGATPAAPSVAGVAEPRSPAASSAAVPDGAAGEAFHVAMAAFATGSYAEADERFAEFVGRFAGDSRCEDAVFLRTVIALRRGDPAAAVARGRSYLRRFPNGFRRREIEAMISTAEDDSRARAGK